MDLDPETQYILLMLALITTEIVFFWWVAHQTVTLWFNYYIIYFYTPILAIRSFIGLFALGERPCCRIPIGFFDLFSTHKFNMLARYIQSAMWTLILFTVLNIRPFYLLYEVSGWGNSPCGASSCTRNDDINLQFQIPFAVYNPKGWFPRGEHQQYNDQGSSRYIFCNYGDQCRWADYSNKPIKSYERVAGACKLNYQKPVASEQGFMSKRIQDYEDLGKGVLNGWAPCKLVGQSFPCRGVTQLTNVGRSNTTNTTAPQFSGENGQVKVYQKMLQKVTDGQTKHFIGKRVCSTCSLYQNSLKSLTLFDTKGIADFKDPDIECVPNVDYSINPWCFVCPGDGGAFGSPFFKFHTETVLQDHLEKILIYCLICTFLPLISMVLLYIYVNTHSKLGYRNVEEEVEENEILGESGDPIDTEPGLRELVRT